MKSLLIVPAIIHIVTGAFVGALAVQRMTATGFAGPFGIAFAAAETVVSVAYLCEWVKR